MRIDLSIFIGIVLTSWVFAVFLLEYFNRQRGGTIKKEMHLEKRRCEVCSSVYFISRFFEFWRCPLCGSLNRERPREEKA